VEESDNLFYYTIQPLREETNCKEIEDIIAVLKNNKTPSEDNINSELIKIGTQQLGRSMDIIYYRGNALLGSCYNILSLALLLRLEIYSRDIIGKRKVHI